MSDNDKPVIWAELSFDQQWKRAREWANAMLAATRQHVDNPSAPVRFSRGIALGYRRMFAVAYMFVEQRISDARSERLKLEKRVAELEARPELKHCGPWREGKRYSKANLCTFRGGLWIALRGNRSKPGENSSWQLIVKSGFAQ
jgi:hypothetical protein